jgi:hypothetical protein
LRESVMSLVATGKLFFILAFCFSEFR